MVFATDAAGASPMLGGAAHAGRRRPEPGIGAVLLGAVVPRRVFGTVVP